MSGAVDDALAPQVPFDPADYPHRFLALPRQPNPAGDVAIVWALPPWPAEVSAGILAALAGGGGVLLMSRDAGALVRQRETLLLLLAPGGSA